MMTAGRDDPMMKRIVSALLLCAMLFTLTAAQAATADMKKAKVSFDLKTGKNSTCYTLYGGLDEGVPIKCKVTNLQMRSRGEDQAQIFFRLTLTNAFEPTDEQIHSMVDNMSDGTIGGIIGYCFADYETGMCLETENDFGVKVDKKEITVNKQKFEAQDGYWIRIPVECVYDLTVTFPKDYDGLCFGVLGRSKPFKTDDDDAFWAGKVPFSKTAYYDKDNKKVSHFMRLKYEDDGRLDITRATFAKIKDKTYNGKPFKPNPKITYDGKKLVKGKDYTLSYSDNVRVGAVAVTVTGKGDYTWHNTVYFNIRKADLGKIGEVTLGEEKFSYTGKEIKPDLTVTATLDGEKVALREGFDYTVTYANNIEPGTATMIISGFLNFDGSILKTFEIVK